MKSITITSASGAEYILSPGDSFTAVDSKNRGFNYTYLGIMPDECGYDIYLQNTSNGTFLNVELEWFRERKFRAA